MQNLITILIIFVIGKYINLELGWMKKIDLYEKKKKKLEEASINVLKSQSNDLQISTSFIFIFIF